MTTNEKRSLSISCLAKTVGLNEIQFRIDDMAFLMADKMDLFASGGDESYFSRHFSELKDDLADLLAAKRVYGLLENLKISYQMTKNLGKYANQNFGWYVTSYVERNLKGLINEARRSVEYKQVVAKAEKLAEMLQAEDDRAYKLFEAREQKLCERKNNCKIYGRKFYYKEVI